MCSSGWLHPSFLSGWASFLERPGFPPNESRDSRIVVFKITSVCFLAEQELIRAERGCTVGLFPPWPADSLSVQWVGAVGQAPRCLPWPPRFSSFTSLAPMGRLGALPHHPSYSQQPLPLRWSPGPPTVFVPLTGCKLGCSSIWWEIAFPGRFPAPH